MKAAIDKSIEILTQKIVGDVKADDALKFTQAALNLAHVWATLEGARHLTSGKE